jgi:hypothetical protein
MKHAVDSLQKAGFRDLKLVVAAFNVLGEYFHPTYADNLRMTDAIAATCKLGIEFKPAMSDSTMGTHAVYSPKNRDKTADFNKHLCLGACPRIGS